MLASNLQFRVAAALAALPEERPLCELCTKLHDEPKLATVFTALRRLRERHGWVSRDSQPEKMPVYSLTEKGRVEFRSECKDLGKKISWLVEAATEALIGLQEEK